MMKPGEPQPRRTRAAGFTLPAVLVVVGALLVLAVGILMVSGIERSTARSFVDRQRADLAACAGLENVRGILNHEASNDDFLIVQHTAGSIEDSKKDPATYLYIARGSAGGDSPKYRYVPLFSTETSPEAGGPLKAPEATSLVGTDPRELTTLPWQGPAKVAWVYLKNPDGKNVSRYAYWVEDLQGKIDARIAGNVTGEGGIHIRTKFPDPPAKPVSNENPPLSAIAIHLLDPASGDKSKPDDEDGKSLTRRIIDGRPAMLSPESIIGATGILGFDDNAAPRNADTGLLTDPIAAALERDVSPVNQAYYEQPVVPFAAGISAAVMGRPKLNLNKLLTGKRGPAVDEMAKWMDDCMPDFADHRKGGFPDDYLKTLAAGALDHADEDGDPTVEPASYVGMDSYPLLSEIVLHIEFLGRDKIDSRHVLKWRFRLFAELWNMSSQPISNGTAKLSYEVNLQPTAIGASAESLPFDDPSILSDPEKSLNNLTLINGKYYGQTGTVNLLPDEYRVFEFADVSYTLDYTPNIKSDGQPKVEDFDLEEQQSEARGITLLWNEQPVQKIESIVRDTYDMSFRTSKPKTAAKAAIPGHGYERNGDYINNPGDPRIAHYFRRVGLAENAYPRNFSPNRRNIRRASIYDTLDKTKEKRLHFGRVLPSEWPDSGHDSPTGAWQTVFDDSILPVNPDAWPPAADPVTGNAPQRISNMGRFYSATELGRVFDPVMWKPAYIDLEGAPGSGLEDTNDLLLNVPSLDKYPSMPVRRNAWPEVTTASTPSTDYGGGNTLRIGRPEHGMFDHPGERAIHLLDLFHAGVPDSENAALREGHVVEIKGNINVNTAGKNALRAMAAGMLVQDPELRRVTDWEHDIASGYFRPKTTPLELGTPTKSLVADRIADAILLHRPFASTAELGLVRDADGDPVFGNRDLYPDYENIQWSDSAAEELFGRVYDASTVRSRNFRVWVIGQAIAGPDDRPEILAESRKVFTVFADPGERKSDGGIAPAKNNPRVTYESDF